MNIRLSLKSDGLIKKNLKVGKFRTKNSRHVRNLILNYSGNS